jgi:hypothetical protein
MILCGEMGLQKYLFEIPSMAQSVGRRNAAPSLVIKCARSNINKGDMERVQVWLVNEESSRSVHEHFGQIVEAYIPSREVFLGECEATPEAVAELADVELEEATAALSKPCELVYVGELYKGDVSANLYLVVYPSQGCK